MTGETKTTSAVSQLGLIFTGGEGPVTEQILCIMREAQILSGDKLLLVAADSGLLLAEKAGLKSDWIIGDMDSLGIEESRLAAYPAEKILRFPEDKDFTDTELAFSLLREKGCKRIWIIGGGGGRLDQLLGLRSLFERNDPPERWITAAEDIRCLEALQRHEIFVPSELVVSSAHNDPLFPVSVFPLGNGPWNAESSGLKWSLSGLPWRRDFIAISNEAPDGIFSISAIYGRFLVLMPFFLE